ncbi:MAG: hypothetical protein FJ044_05490 [Candidatus Cloacimonetes bacterium]|nr:hypothetical protein [Candidatus Cloacimonadota bacterium]
MTNLKSGTAHLTTLFILAILLIASVLIVQKQTQTNLKASGRPGDYYGIVRKNDFLDCASHFHLVNLEEDEIAHCLVISRTSAANDESVANLVDQNVKIYGEVLEIGGKRHLLIQSIEKSAVSYNPSLMNKFLDVLGDFIKKISP